MLGCDHKQFWPMVGKTDRDSDYPGSHHSVTANDQLQIGMTFPVVGRAVPHGVSGWVDRFCLSISSAELIGQPR